jgi:hypothetical protein
METAGAAETQSALRQEWGVEIVALVVDQNEGREVLDRDLIDRLHPELGIGHDLLAGDVVLGQPGGRAADRAKVESSVGLARRRALEEFSRKRTLAVLPPA